MTWIEQTVEKQDSTFQMMKILKERQDKFVYYILGLNIATIGFTVSKSYNEKMDLEIIWLGFAMIFWMISILFAILWLNLQFEIMQKNMYVVDLIDGHYDKKSINIKERNSTLSRLKFDLTDGDPRKANFRFKTSIYTFFGGIVFFITWRIIEMI